MMKGMSSLTRMVVLTGAWLALSSFAAQGQRWQNDAATPVPYMLDPAGSDDIPDDSELAALRTAFNSWEEVSCSYLKFEEQPWSTPKVVSNDGVNRIFWIDVENQWPGQDATLALTYVFYSLADNRAISDADMIFNGLTWTWTTNESEIGQGTPGKVDVETVAFHEAGHFFGLDHSTDPEAAMYPSNNKPMQRFPATDDVQGICSLYPNGQPVPGQSGGNNGGGPVGAPCQQNGDCQSSLCARDDQLGRTYCTAQCTVTDPTSCPAGFPCTATGVGDYCLAALAIDELCDFCSSGDQCATGLCVSVPFRNFNQPFCTKPCDPANPTGQCPNGYQCELTQTETTQLGVCVPNSGVCEPTGKGGHNEACYANGNCKAGHACLEWTGSGMTFCFAQCVPGDARYCGPREECTQVAGQNLYVCLTKAGVGEPCLPEVCIGTSQCLTENPQDIDAALCYASCPNGQADCPANTACDSTGLAVGACVPMDGFKVDGQPCSSNAECESRLCTVFPGGDRICTRECAITSETNDCSPGLRCLASEGSSQGHCYPEAFTTQQDAPFRGITTQSTYCPCDTSNACDADCDCDPECEGSSCSCEAATGSERGFAAPNPVWTLLLLLAGGVLLSARGRRRCAAPVASRRTRSSSRR